jgi:hypothetical protein
VYTCIMSPLLTLATLAAVSLSTSAPSFAWTCGSNRICVESVSRGNLLLVRYRAEAPVTHVNVIPVSPQSGQFEASGSAGSFGLSIGFGSKVRYKMQRCVRGGIGQRSTCGPWVTFSRKVE